MFPASRTLKAWALSALFALAPVAAAAQSVGLSGVEVGAAPGGSGGGVSSVATDSTLTGGPCTTSCTLSRSAITGAVTIPGASNVSSLGSFTSAQLATALTDETGSGAAVFGTAPVITLPNATGLPIATGVSGLGTGVATALGVNVGSAGAVVVNGGAIGAATGTSLALNGATIGSNVLAGTGTFAFSGIGSASGFNVTGSTIPTNGIFLDSANVLGFSANSTEYLTLNSSVLAAKVSGGPEFQLIAPTGSIPSVVTNSLDQTTGLGGAINHAALIAGATDQFDCITTGCVGGSATGGTKGAGSINATGLYVNGTAVTASSWVLLNTLTASNSAALSDTTSITGTYKNYAVVMDALVPATNSSNPEFLYSVNGGTSYLASGYANAIGSRVAYCSFWYTPTLGAFVELAQSSASMGVNGNLTFTANGGGAAYNFVGYGPFAGFDTTNNVIVYTYGCSNSTTTAVNAIRFQFSSGNITSGNIKIYGIP